MKVVVARMWYKLSKEAYFGLLHITQTFPNIDFEFHLIINLDEYKDEYTKRIFELGLNLTLYTKKQMTDFLKQSFNTSDDFIKNIPNFIHFYHIIIGWYLRKTKNINYFISYEYDVVFNSLELDELENCLVNNIPFGIIEPKHAGCDKGNLNQFNAIFRTNFLIDIQKNNPSLLGINAGFQGINAKIFDSFPTQQEFEILMSCFDFLPFIDENGNQRVTGYHQTIFETQEQSFYGIFNQAVSDNFKLLSPFEYYFDTIWDEVPQTIENALNSKVLHFTGHKKSKIWYDFMDNYLKNIQ